jgi:hypothetical protein
MHEDALRELVRDSRYPFDEAAVAEAIVVRATIRRLVPGVRFRSEMRSGGMLRATQNPRSLGDVGAG